MALMFLFLFLCPWQIFGAATSSCRPFIGSWACPSPTPFLRSLHLLQCLSRAVPSAATPQGHIQLLSARRPSQLTAGASTSVVRHSSFPSPTSPASGAPAGPLTIVGANAVTWQLTPLQQAPLQCPCILCPQGQGTHTHARWSPKVPLTRSEVMVAEGLPIFPTPWDNGLTGCQAISLRENAPSPFPLCR